MSNGREFHCFGAQQEENRVLAESSNLNSGMHHASSSYKFKKTNKQKRPVPGHPRRRCRSPGVCWGSPSGN